MKKITITITILIISLCSFAQSNASEQAPVLGLSHPPLTVSTEKALWDIQLDAAAATVGTGLAGCYWTGTEFWIAKWSNDSIFTANSAGVATGSFVIAGLTGTRSITSDGTSLYIGANDPNIYKVDPVTKTLTSTIVTSVLNCRYVTYDPTLNAGAGGFWTGTFATDWTAVSMTGATLTTIPASTHGLGSVYGLAYDNHSAGGPYLWAYDQGASGVSAILNQVSIATGAPTGLTHDTEVDLQGGNTGIAGGVFVCNNFVPGTTTIGGCDQGSSIFCYNIQALAGINENNMADFDMNIYPNPAVTSSTVSFNLKGENTVKMNLYSILGTLVYSASSQTMNAGKHTLSLNTTNLDNGIYFVNLTVGNQTVAKKVSVNR